MPRQVACLVLLILGLGYTYFQVMRAGPQIEGYEAVRGADADELGTGDSMAARWGRRRGAVGPGIVGEPSPNRALRIEGVQLGVAVERQGHRPTVC